MKRVVTGVGCWLFASEIEHGQHSLNCIITGLQNLAQINQGGSVHADDDETARGRAGDEEGTVDQS